jgi:hypothetical protein
VVENNGIELELLRRNGRKRVFGELIEDSVNRKIFSHREHGFPTEGETGNW